LMDAHYYLRLRLPQSQYPYGDKVLCQKVIEADHQQ
jgi:hypothetical protein